MNLQKYLTDFKKLKITLILHFSSITILTLLKKQSYKNTFEEMVAPTDLYDKFLANLKQNLSIHKRTLSSGFDNERHFKKKVQSIPMLTEGSSVSDIIEDISEYDPDLIAAYDVIAADLPELEIDQDVFIDGKL